MKDKARIAVLVSGGGTNLQALIDAQQKGIITSGEIALVVSNVISILIYVCDSCISSSPVLPLPAA